MIRRKEFNTDLNSPKSLIDSDREGDLEAKSNVEVNREANTLKNSAKNINIFNITNSNKQTDIANNDFCRRKNKLMTTFTQTQKPSK